MKPELLNKGIPTGPPKENELTWISCPKKEENGCEYHVRVFKKTIEANLKMHQENHCPLITTGDDVPEHFTNSTPAPAGAGKADMPSEKPQEPLSREESPEDEPTPSHSWEPLRKAISAEEYDREVAPCLGCYEPKPFCECEIKEKKEQERLDETRAAIRQFTDEERYAKWLEKQKLPVEKFASGLKRDITDGKVNWSLVYDGPLLRRWAILMTEGAKVKGKHNWLSAGSVPETAEDDLERFREGAARHFAQWMSGETDEDHAAAVIFNLNGAEHVKARMANNE